MPWSVKVYVSSPALVVLFKIQSIINSKIASVFPFPGDASAAEICWLGSFGNDAFRGGASESSEDGSRRAWTSFQEVKEAEWPGHPITWVVGHPRPFSRTCYCHARKPSDLLMVSPSTQQMAEHLLIHCVQGITFLFHICSPEMCMAPTGLEVVTTWGQRRAGWPHGKATSWTWATLQSVGTTTARKPALDSGKALGISYTFPSAEQRYSDYSSACLWFDAPCNGRVHLRLVDLGHGFQKLGCQLLCLLKFDIQLAQTSSSC